VQAILHGKLELFEALQARGIGPALPLLAAQGFIKLLMTAEKAKNI